MRSVLLIGFVVLLAMGCGKQNENGEQFDPEVKYPSKPPKKPVKPDFKVTVEEYEAERQKDPAAAEAKYDGKIVELTGTIRFISLSRTTNPIWVSLDASGKDEKFIKTMLCEFDDLSLITKLGVGQTLTVQMEVGSLLNPCVLVEKGPDTILTISAEQLAKDYSADAEKTKKANEERTIKISGEVAAIRILEGGNFKILELKGDGNSVIECRLASFFDSQTIEKYKVGEFVTLIVSSFSTHNRVFYLEDCVPIPLKR